MVERQEKNEALASERSQGHSLQKGCRTGLGLGQSPQGCYSA